MSWRSRIASLQKSDLLGLTQPAGTPRPQTSDRRGTHHLFSFLTPIFEKVVLGSMVFAEILYLVLNDCLSGFVPDVEASTGESETERWARERRERRQARARRKAQRTGEVNTALLFISGKPMQHG